MFTRHGSIYQIVTLCREPSGKSFSNHLMAQADLLTDIMVQLRGGTGKVPKDNASSRFQVLRICPSSRAALSISYISNSSSRVSGAPKAMSSKTLATKEFPIWLNPSWLNSQYHKVEHDTLLSHSLSPVISSCWILFLQTQIHYPPSYILKFQKSHCFIWNISTWVSKKHLETISTI